MRDVERTAMEVVPSPKRAAWQETGDGFSRTQIGGTVKTPAVSRTLGWSPSCECFGDKDIASDGWAARPHDPVPCTVLDPFGGSGTTALVARKHGRHSVLVELNETYCALAASRLSQLSLLTGKETG